MNYRFAAITGAGQGIGRAIALKLAAEGVSVALLGRRKDKLEEVAGEIKKLGYSVKAFPFQGDVRDKKSTQEFLRESEKAIGPLDIIVDNAGVGHIGSFATLEENEVQELIETNFMGAVWSTYFAMRLFEERQRGALVHISSTTTLQPAPKASLYAATKWGMLGLIRSLEEEYIGNKNIRIVNITTGTTFTGFFTDQKDEIQMKNIIHPEDIADCVWWSLGTPSNYQVSSMVVRPLGDYLKNRTKNK